MRVLAPFYRYGGSCTAGRGRLLTVASGTSGTECLSKCKQAELDLRGVENRLDQPGEGDAKVAMPTTAALMGFPPIEPSNGALPKEKTPPSDAASQ